MKQLPNFSLTAQAAVSSFFTERNIRDFFSAIRYLKMLPSTFECSPHNLLQVAREGGTSSAKNALLFILARENNQSAIKLVLCTYAVDYSSNPLVRYALDKHALPALPEASCYLKYNRAFYTVTKESFQVTQSVISDIEITPQQIGSFAQRYYHHFVKHWLQLEKLHPSWTVDKIRKVRQECLQTMEKHPWQTIHPPFEA